MMLKSMVYRLIRGAYRSISFQPTKLREKFYKQIISAKENQDNYYLESLLNHASLNVSYYRNICSSFKNSKLDIQNWLVLDKGIIRENFEQLKSDKIEYSQSFLNSSGGSTGQPITIIQDRNFKEWRIATQLFYYRQFLGIEIERISHVILWGTENIYGDAKSNIVKYNVLKYLQSTTFLNSFRMTLEDLHNYVDIINNKKPILIKGYAGSLYQLAKFARNNNLYIHHPQVIYSSAETLRPFMRNLIEEVFDCKVYDFYGSREVGPIAGECSRGKMHIFSFNNYVEVVNKNNETVQAGEEGKILVTTLHNYSMPLIRYNIGDTAILGKSCDCGSSLPTLERVTGRVKEHFVTRKGTLIDGGYFTRQFYFRDWVDEFQVLQKDFSTIEIFYVPKGEVVKTEQDDISNKIRLVMGKECQINWNQVKQIPRTPHGKLLYTRSLVDF